ncbi:hypothetical protein I4U23_016458 [Adineta vaga]|nr:hypothetical protein I4U23_016458 [Adineta vaga]
MSATAEQPFTDLGRDHSSDVKTTTTNGTSTNCSLSVKLVVKKFSNESKTKLKYKLNKKAVEMRLINVVESISRFSGINDEVHLTNKSVIEFKSNTDDGLTRL